MPTVVVYTDKGEQVWQMPADAYSLRNANCFMNTNGSSIISGLRRAVEDAEAIEQGCDPERPSEKAMRKALLPKDYGNLASYTKKHMENLAEHGATTEWFNGTIGGKNRARSRIINAANRLGLKVRTEALIREGQPVIIATVKEQK